MHFLFVSSILGPTTGGIETLIARMSQWLIEKGHRITLLANTAQRFLDLFPAEIKVIELGGQLRQFCSYHKARTIWPSLQIERPDVIKSFHPRDSWISSILSSLIKPAPKILFGQYFPFMFIQSRNPFKDVEHKFYMLNMRLNYPDDSILCTDKEQVFQFRRQYGVQRNPTFWPLPINDPSKNAPTRSPEWCHIVSIGRLEPMKEYNLYMIDVVARLRQKGFPVKWTVYGEGRFADVMKARIEGLGLNDAIQLKGKLAYLRFASALHNAYLFVGEGTSIIEAALCGVPGVMALASDTTGATYGSLYRFPFGNLGTPTRLIPGTTVEAEIERIIKLHKPEYEEEIKRNREYAQAYSIDISMDMFLQIVAKASLPKSPYALFYYYYAHKLIEVSLERAKLATWKLTGKDRRTFRQVPGLKLRMQ